MQTTKKENRQLPDGRWSDEDEQYRFAGHHRWDGDDELIRAIHFLNNNSANKHNIVVSIDSDIYPNEKFLKEFDNVIVVKSSYISKDENYQPFFRISHAVLAGINAVPDEEWVCHGYLADLICGKNWDKPIIDAIKDHGEKYIYSPQFVEVRNGYGNVTMKGIDPTWDLIWNEWRNTCSWNALMMPIPSKGYFTEEDIDYYIKRATEKDPNFPLETPGVRKYCTYLCLVMKAKYAKAAFRPIGPGCDIDFDNRLHTVCGLVKKPITNSFLFHPYSDFRWKGEIDGREELKKIQV
ncbi:hypothetical protein KKF82_08830 [Patescibacteria group bacterium]|nr:hypothetical protein [Patescibacteria group bacterium]